LRVHSLDEDFLPFRDDILFDMTWPGPQEVGESHLGTEKLPHYESQVGGEGGVESTEGMDGAGHEQEVVDEGLVVSTVQRPNLLLPEDDYDGVHYVDMRTGKSNEKYRCVVPKILSPKDDVVGGYGVWQICGLQFYIVL
jgi:hypothetical protein